MPLHPEYEAMLAQAAEAGGPALSEMTVDEGREMYRTMSPPVDIEVGKVENRAIPGPAADIGVRIYTPAGDGPFPVIVMFHGGGWVIGDLETHDGQSRELCNGSECIVVSVDYRLAPEHKFPAAADDCYAATEWAKDNAVSIGGDPAKLAVAGDSAGGNLAAVVAQMARDKGGPKIDFQLLVYPVTDGTHLDTDSYLAKADGYGLTRDAMIWFWDHYATEEDRRNPYASPLIAGDLGGLPPALVMTAEYDPLCDEGKMYADKLQAAGVATEYVRYDGLVHGFFQHGPLFPCSRPAMAKACAELKKTFA